MILNDNSTQQINTLVIQLQNRITNLNNELKSLNKETSDLNSEISDLEKRVSSNVNDASINAAAMNAAILANTKAISGKADKSHTHTKSQITDFPTSLPANGGTADSAATANNGFNSSTVTDSTPWWGYLTSDNGYSNGRTYSFANGGGIATAEKDTKTSLQVDGDLYVHEGLDKVATLNDIPTSLPANGGTADYAKNMYYQNLDLSNLDKTKFYPLVCYSATYFAEVAICSESGMGSMEYNQNRIHFDISTQGWSDTRFTLNIREYACYENNEITIGCIGRGVHYGTWAIWLRGGLHYTCFSRDSNLSLYTSDYTFDDETYTVGTNYYGGSNSNVEVVFTPQSTITNGSYSNRPIAAPNITSLEQRVAALESKA